jgi:hypothetical protein
MQIPPPIQQGYRWGERKMWIIDGDCKERWSRTKMGRKKHMVEE